MEMLDARPEGERRAAGLGETHPRMGDRSGQVLVTSLWRGEPQDRTTGDNDCTEACVARLLRM